MTIALLAAAATTAAVASGSPADAVNPVSVLKGPLVTVVGNAPLVVSGVRFAPGARVAVRLSRPTGTIVRTTRVGAQGRFFVRFDSVRLAACSTPNVTVLWRLGVVRARGPQRECMTP
jgi:hypothetical protein